MHHPVQTSAPYSSRRSTYRRLGSVLLCIELFKTPSLPFPFQDVLSVNLTVGHRHLRLTLTLSVARIETIRILVLISLAWPHPKI